MNIETKDCKVCGKTIYKKTSEALRTWSKKTTCSTICRGIWVGRLRKSKQPRKQCKNCGTQFQIIESLLPSRVFCTQKCQTTYNSGKNHYRFKGRKISAGGYIRVFYGKEHPFSDPIGYLFEHRFVVEQYLKKHDTQSKYLVEIDGEKYLSPQTIVHHKDHNKENNDVSNLVPVLSQKEHFEHHFCPYCSHCNKLGELLENPRE